MGGGGVSDTLSQFDHGIYNYLISSYCCRTTGHAHDHSYCLPTGSDQPTDQLAEHASQNGDVGTGDERQVERDPRRCALCSVEGDADFKVSVNEEE